MNIAKVAAAVFACAGGVLLSGCPAMVAAGAAGGAVMANDDRTAGAFLEDEVIENKALYRLHEAEITAAAHVVVTSYNRRVLLTGQVPDAETNKRIEGVINGIKNVREMINQLERGNPSSLSARASDAALTGRAKIALCRLQIEGFSCLDVKIVSEKGVVYLLGLVTKEQAAIAIAEVRNLPGVIKVVKVFEYR